MKTTPTTRLTQLARRQGVIRSRDAKTFRIGRDRLTIGVAEGKLVRIGRGLYVAAGAKPSAHQSLIEASKRVPGGVVCLLSALRFHGLTTQNPAEVWLAIGEKARKPKVDYPPLRIVRFSGHALAEGVQEQSVKAARFRVTSAARTVADCFKYRNKIGLDVALEALRECRRHRKCSMDDLWHYAKLCRVANVMRPYLEVMA